VSAGLHKSRLPSALVAATQISLSLLICAGLFIRSLQNARRLGPGFDPSHVLLVPVRLGPRVIRGLKASRTSARFDRPARATPSSVREGQPECCHLLPIANQENIAYQHRVIPSLALDRREVRELCELIGASPDQCQLSLFR
jgi:hypothetical protein